MRISVATHIIVIARIVVRTATHLIMQDSLKPNIN